MEINFPHSSILHISVTLKEYLYKQRILQQIKDKCYIEYSINESVYSV